MLDNFTNGLQWVVVLPLSVRVKQISIAFSMNTLSQSSAINYGFIGAAALAAIVIALLVAGADGPALRGAGLAALLAAAVLLLPLLLALTGHDNYVARGTDPGLDPAGGGGRRRLYSGARPRTRRAARRRAAGAVRLRRHPDRRPTRIYQRPNWRGVADALGNSTGPRAILACDGQFASGPLSIYLRNVPWSGPGQSAALPAPTGKRVGGRHRRDERRHPDDAPAGCPADHRRASTAMRSIRVALAAPWRGTAAEIQARASQLLSPAPPAPTVMIQRPADLLAPAISLASGR